MAVGGLAPLLLAIAVSLDGLGVGAAYGSRGVRVGPGALAIIGLCSGVALGLSMLAGRIASSLWLQAALAQRAGGALLVGLGLWHLVSGLLRGLPPATVARFRVGSVGIVIQILRDPEKADLDRSGAIDLREAVLVGTALGLDALAAGFGAALAGFGPLAVALVVATQPVAVWAGTRLGRRMAKGRLGERGFVVPAALLILLGLLKIRE